MISARADQGGGPRHMLDLINALSSSAVIFSASPNQKPYGQLFKEKSEAFFEIPSRRFSIFTFFGLLSFCYRNQISIVHSHGRGAGSYSFLLCFFGFQVLHTFHGYHPKSLLSDKLLRFLESNLFRLGRVFIAVSKGELRRVSEFNPHLQSRTVLIFNGVESDSATSSKIKREAYTQLSPLVFGCLTRLDKQKGNDVLIQHFGSLPKEILSKTKLRIAGEGPEEAKLKELTRRLNLQDHVEFVGVASDPSEFLSRCDYYVSASFGEGLSYSTLEALREGLPLLLSNVTGHDELTGVLGVHFFELNDSSSFRDQLAGILVQPRLKSELPPHFSLAQMAQSTLNIYNQVREGKL
jgi:glycosyltransferase involved in cell wall biosynthesis